MRGTTAVLALGVQGRTASPFAGEVDLALDPAGDMLAIDTAGDVLVAIPAVLRFGASAARVLSFGGGSAARTASTLVAAILTETGEGLATEQGGMIGPEA